MAAPVQTDEIYAAAERRIEYLTLAVGAAAAIVATILWRPGAGGGVAAGAVLSWINFRWMKQGVGTLARLSTTQSGVEQPRVPRSVYFKFLGRYALLIVTAYAILRGFSLPPVSFVCGLFAVAAAVIVEMITQLLRGGALPRANS